MLSPASIANKRFVVRWRGYDTGEVEAFLRAVADDQQRILGYLRRAVGGTDVPADVALAAALRGDAETDPILQLNRITAELAELVQATRHQTALRRGGAHRDRDRVRSR